MGRAIVTDTLVIRGVEELADAFETIGDKVAKKFIRKALTAAGKPILREVRRRAYRAPGGPTYPEKGHFADHITVSTSVPKSGKAAVKVGPEKGYAWANLVEYGTPTMSAHPAMRPGLEAARNEAIQAFENELWEQIEQEFKNLGIR